MKITEPKISKVLTEGASLSEVLNPLMQNDDEVFRDFLFSDQTVEEVSLSGVEFSGCMFKNRKFVN